MSKREVWTKRCDNGSACVMAAPDYVVPGAAYVPDDQDLCDWCIKYGYDLEITHDSLDQRGYQELVTLESAIAAIRRARAGN